MEGCYYNKKTIKQQDFKLKIKTNFLQWIFFIFHDNI